MNIYELIILLCAHIHILYNIFPVRNKHGWNLVVQNVLNAQEQKKVNLEFYIQ